MIQCDFGVCGRPVTRYVDALRLRLPARKNRAKGHFFQSDICVPAVTASKFIVLDEALVILDCVGVLWLHQIIWLQLQGLQLYNDLLLGAWKG